MYEAMDDFMQTPTWHKEHDADKARFYVALSKIVLNPEFNADQMGKHPRTFYDESKESASYYGATVERLVRDAWAVRDYLKANHII